MSIQVRKLRKTYDGFSVEVDLSVASDEILVLAGPSGCGKTTALQLIAGLVDRDSGEVLVDGESVADLPAWRRGIGIVFQDLALFPHLTVGGNVGYGPLIAGVPREERGEIVAAELAAVRLSGYQRRRVDTLSGGERQRVAIARALAAAPKALLMDEPFSSLDAPLRRELRSEFRRLKAREGFPCVFVTHDREEAAAVGDRIAVMKDGRIVESGEPARLFNEPATAFVANFLGSGAILPVRERRPLPGGGTAVRSALGGSAVAHELSAEHALLVPPDSVSLAPADAAGIDAAALVSETFFEGDGTGVLLDLGRGEPQLRARLDRRTAPPKTGDRVGLRIDWKLVRPVDASI